MFWEAELSLRQHFDCLRQSPSLRSIWQRGLDAREAGWEVEMVNRDHVIGLLSINWRCHIMLLLEDIIFAETSQTRCSEILDKRS